MLMARERDRVFSLSKFSTQSDMDGDLEDA